MRCLECRVALTKAYCELDDGTWRPVWLCACQVPEDTTGIVPFNVDQAMPAEGQEAESDEELEAEEPEADDED